MRRVGWVLATIVLGAGGRARAGETLGSEAPPAFRLYLAAGAGAMLGLDVSKDGKPAPEPNDYAANAGVTVGFDRRVAGWLSLGGEARYGTWESSWAKQAGYDDDDGGHQRAGLDLDGLARILAPPMAGFPVRLSLAPSAGLTLPTSPERRTRAVREAWEPHLGANAGLALEGEIWRQVPGMRWKIGVAVSVLYTRHWMALDGTSSPVSDPAAAVSARYHYVTDTVLVRVGLLAGP
jgi:hypothetical protein